MKPKILCIIGLLFLTLSQLLLAQGFDFLQAQQPIDFAHWFMLIGAILLLSFNYVFPKSIFNSIAIVLTSLGVIAHIGMCPIDIALWSFGEDAGKRNELIGHLINTPSIWYPFFVIGPSLLYIGLSIHAWKFIASHPISAILAIGGSALIGAGQFMGLDRRIVVLGCILFAIGLLLLVYRDEIYQNKRSLSTL